MGKIIFVTGGCRSGKSGYAQSRAESHDGKLLYVATAEVRDEEMADRVERHQQDRGERWRALEEPLALATAIPAAASDASALMLDCLTLWLSNLFECYGNDEAEILRQGEVLLKVLSELDVTSYIVSNELGSGIVPENRLARQFRDLAGKLNQQFAAAADEAWLVVAGLPLQLK